MQSGRGWWLEALIVFAVVGGAALFASSPFVFQFGDSAHLERVYALGFYAAEETPDGVGGAWSQDAALLRLPWSEIAGTARISVRMAAPRNPGQPPPAVYLNLDGQPLGQFAPDANLKDYSITLPLRGLHLSDAYLYINSETFTAKGDSRKLGVFVSSVTLEGDNLAFGLPRAALVAIIALAICALARRLSGMRWIGLSSGLLVGLLMSLGLVIARTQIAPYLTGWLTITLAAWLAIAAADRFSGKLGAGSLVPLTYAAFLYPIAALTQVAWDKIYPADLLNGRAATVPGGVLLYATLLGGGLLLGTYLVWGSDTPKLRRATLIIFLAVAAAYYLADHAYMFSHNLYGGIDLKQDYDALVSWRTGGSPYNLQQAILQPGTAVKLPPIFGYFLLPQIAAGWSFAQVLLWWRIGNELLYALAVYVTLRAFDLRPLSEAGGAVIWLALMSGEVAETLGWGQFNVIILLGVAATLWLIRKGRLPGAGLALALPVMLKFFPASMALPLAMSKRGWRGLAGLAAGFIALALLPIPLLGGDTFTTYWTQIFPSIGGGADEGVSNQSIYAMVGRLAVSEVTLEHSPPGAWWVQPLAYALIGLLVALTIWLVWRTSHPHHQTVSPDGGGAQASEGRTLYPYLLALALGLLIIPFAWLHYETVLLPCFVGTMLWLAQGRDKSRAYAINEIGGGMQFIAPWAAPLFAIAFVLIGYGGRYEFVGNYAVGLDRIGASEHGLAVLLLWLLLAIIIWRQGGTYGVEETRQRVADDVEPAATG